MALGLLFEQWHQFAPTPANLLARLCDSGDEVMAKESFLLTLIARQLQDGAPTLLEHARRPLRHARLATCQRRVLPVSPLHVTTPTRR
jgi:hypothetical protein